MAKRDLGDVAVTALTRPGVGAALLAALGVYVVLVVQAMVGTLSYVFAGFANDLPSYLSLVVNGVLPTALGTPLPFAVGVFLAFWQIAPVSPQLRMAHVVTRALLAAVIGAVIAAIIGLLFALVISLVNTPASLVASSGPEVFARAVASVSRAVLPAALNMLVSGLAVVPLAALLLWGWLQSHPTKSAPRGALDEV